MAHTDQFNGDDGNDPTAFPVIAKLLLALGFFLLALALLCLCVTVCACCACCLERLPLFASFRRSARSNRPRRPASVREHDSPRVEGLGLQKWVIEGFPVFVYSSEIHKDRLECAVCLSDFQENEKAKTLPNCKHNFHVECIDTWFRSHSTCPLCRTAAQPHTPSVADCIVIAVDGETSGTTAEQVPPVAVEKQ